MKFRKFVTTALVAGAGLALSASAFAQSSSSTFTSGTDGTETSIDVTVHASTTQFTHTFTSGGAVAIAIATPIGVGGAGASIPEFSFTSSSTSDSSSSVSTASVGSGVSPSFSTSTSSTSASSSSNTTLGTDGNGRSSTTAFNHDSIFVHVDASEAAGSANVTGTHTTGIALAALFVFEQTLTVDAGGNLTDATAQPFTVDASGLIAAGVSGSLALNLVSGIGNEQGNNLSTAAEVDGSNSVEAEGRQTLTVDGTITEGAKTSGDLVTLGGTSGTASLGTIAGAAAINIAAGTGNQQVNNISLAH